MKELKFETSKGEFLIIEGEEQAYKLWGSKNFISKLSEITEEQAREIVDEIHGNVSFITTLNIFLKSKGINLFENPLNTGTSIKDYDLYLEAEQKTFYNPYIFKL